MADDSPGADPVKTGDVIEGRYRIIRALDEGGMGRVYLAEHVLIKRRVAIKLLRAELAADSDVVERFMNEARAAGTLGHPHIVESTDMGFTRDGIPYIVFEYLEGSLLTDEIYRVGGLRVRRALRIARQIASALQTAHTAGIVHRDMKSDNVFLTVREESVDHVKVLDFGISRFLEADDDRSGARSIVMGTPQFMAPEQILSPEKVDGRADIYALGVILYEMLAARRPFKNDDSDKLLGQIVHDAPPPLDVADLPPGLAEMLFDKLLAKDPADRYQSMKEVESALEAFSGVLRIDGRDTQPIPVASLLDAPADLPTAANVVTLPPPPRTHPVAWLVGALLAGGLGVALLFVDREPTTPVGDNPALALLQADAEKLGTTIESETHAAQLRVDGIAQTPMLRAAVETDAATVKDMIRDADFVFTSNKGEVAELFQIRDDKTTSMLKIPDAGDPIAPLVGNKVRIETDGKRLTIVVGAPVMTQHAAVGGAIALSVPIELAAIEQRMAQHVEAATLVGLARPIVLVPNTHATPASTKVTLPVAINREIIEGLSIAAEIPPVVVAARSNTVGIVRVVSWGLGGGLLLIYLVALLWRRRRG